MRMVGPDASPVVLVSETGRAASVPHKFIRFFVLAVMGSLLLTASAKVQVPFWPVPLTMQTFVVLFIGMVGGARLGTAMVALYLAEGAIGLPVFSGTPTHGIGLAYMLGPTGGYLIGFLVSAYVVGLFARRGWGRHLSLALAAMLIGTAVIFMFGHVWLSIQIGPAQAFAVGVLPFLPGELLKMALAVTLLRVTWRGVEHVRQR